MHRRRKARSHRTFRIVYLTHYCRYIAILICGFPTVFQFGFRCGCRAVIAECGVGGAMQQWRWPNYYDICWRQEWRTSTVYFSNGDNSPITCRQRWLLRKTIAVDCSNSNRLLAVKYQAVRIIQYYTCKIQYTFCWLDVYDVQSVCAV